MKHYRSSIPNAAKERVVAGFASNRNKSKSEYWLKGKLVGYRLFHECGELEQEYPLRNGKLHGTVYRSDVPGKILSAEPYRDGLPHGVARQWSNGEKLLGTYTMRKGTGLDLWWVAPGESAPVYLAEARYLKDGKRHGVEWWLQPDQASVWEERYFWENSLHGIERQWNYKGTLRRGYPRYWVRGKRVTKSKYSRLCEKDSSLPAFRERENRPQRRFPRDVRDAVR